jgi:hypothetical protein
MFGSSLAGAAEATRVAPVVADASVHLLGQLNVNTASRTELARLLDGAVLETVLQARATAPIVELSALPLDEETRAHLKTSGVSDLRRIRQMPLQVYELPATTSRR